MQKIILIGGGGHCKVVIDAIRESNRYEIEGIVDWHKDTEEKILNIPVIGNDDNLQDIYNKGIKNAFIAVGSIGDCILRKELYKKIKKIGFKVPIIVHPKAVIAKDVDIGEGTFVAASATSNPGTKIGKNVIINTSSSIDHDCEIGDFVHIAPGATLSGGVKVGEETHIGIGANVIQNIKISKKRFISAGSLVKH